MNRIKTTNLFKDLPESRTEWFQTLLENAHTKVERIVSKGHASPEGFWYDQDWDEWVAILKGRAGLIIEGQPEVVLEVGDCLLIPAGLKHRVAWTDSSGETIWLAVHMYADRA